MKMHEENIFRYLLACFIVAAFGLVTSWVTAEKNHESAVARSSASIVVPAQNETASDHQ